MKIRHFAMSTLLAFTVSIGLGGFLSHASAVLTASTEVVAEAPKPEIRAKASIQSVLITDDRENVQITSENSGDMSGTDGNFYIFEYKAYYESLEGRKDYLAKVGTGRSVTTLPLKRHTVHDRLYSSFVIAVYDGNKYVPVSDHHYITNPEVVAPNQAPFNDPLTKKGLNIEINMLADAFELGVKHVATNITFHQIMGEGIDFVYDGETYHFSKAVMEEYDKTISALSGKGMTVTAIILNGFNPNEPDLFPRGTKQTKDAAYYMFNAETEAGFKKTKALAAFLAQRYNGQSSQYGKISNWIIGNEINNQYWNYIGKRDVYDYVRTYEKAFRIFYTAIKSTSANDRVYFSIDYNWNHDAETNNKTKYRGKQVVDVFNSFTNQKGQIRWGLAYHPYPYPMTEPEFWDDVKTGLFTDKEDSPVINFANLNTLTNYFAKDQLRTYDGKTRPIILTEQGFTATSQSGGDVSDIQAAAYAYSYYQVDSNPMIDAYILSRQVDAPLEVRLGLSFGLWKSRMDVGDNIVATQRRKIWSVFKNIDKKNSTLESTEFAKSIIGIEKWSDVIPNFKWKSLEK